jgi:hypothetical protein
MCGHFHDVFICMKASSKDKNKIPKAKRMLMEKIKSEIGKNRMNLLAFAFYGNPYTCVVPKVDSGCHCKS